MSDQYHFNEGVSRLQDLQCMQVPICTTHMLQSLSMHGVQEEEAAEQLKRMIDSKFDFNDFLKQLQTMNNMGGMQLMKLLPGMNKVRAHVCMAMALHACMHGARHSGMHVWEALKPSWRA